MARKNMTTKAGKKQVTKRVHKKKAKMTPKKKKTASITSITTDPYEEPL